MQSLWQFKSLCPCQKRTVIVIRLPFFSAIFAFGELYWLRQLYLLRKLYCPTGSFGDEYNITAAKRQYRFCAAKISLRRRRNITKKGSVVADRQQLQSLLLMKSSNNLTKGRCCVHFNPRVCKFSQGVCRLR